MKTNEQIMDNLVLMPMWVYKILNGWCSADSKDGIQTPEMNRAVDGKAIYDKSHVWGILQEIQKCISFCVLGDKYKQELYAAAGWITLNAPAE